MNRPMDFYALVGAWRARAEMPLDGVDEPCAIAAMAMDETLIACADELEAALCTPTRQAGDGWRLVPVEPTERMVVEGFESRPDEHFSAPEVWAEYEAMSGCQQAAHRARLCWAAMLAAAPHPPQGGGGEVG